MNKARSVLSMASRKREHEEVFLVPISIPGNEEEIVKEPHSL